MNETPLAPPPRILTALGGLVPILIVIAAAVLPRLASLRGDVDFVWDDRVLLVNDARTADLSSIPGYFVGPYFRDHPEVGLYRPLVNTTLTIERVLFGDGVAWAHRLVNLLLHVLASILLYLVARRLVPGRPVVPLLAAVLFAEHPATTEAVCWIVARGDSGAALFSLLAIRLYLARRPAALIGAAAALFVALLFKPVALVVPAILVLVEMNRHGRRFREVLRPARLVPIVVIAIPVAVVFLMRRAAIGGFVPSAEGVVLRETDVVYRIILAGGLLVRNLLAIVFPIGLTGDYQADPAWREGPAVPGTGYMVASALVLAAVAYLAYRRRRGGLETFGILWAVLFLLPVLQLVPIGALLADRFLYLPAMGVALAGASAIDRLAGGVWASSVRARTVGVGVSLLLSCYFGLDLVRSAAYQDDGAFNRDILARFPDDPGEPWRAKGQAEVRVRLGLHHERVGLAAKPSSEARILARRRAEAEYVRAGELDPKSSVPMLRLGGLYVDERRHEEAVVLLMRALAAKGSEFTRAAIEYDLARALVAGEEEKIRRQRGARSDPMALADAHLARALKRRPRFPEALYLRGRILVRYLGKPEEGRALLREAIALDPRLEGKARRWLFRPEELAQADLLVKQRRVDDALETLRAGLEKYDDPTRLALIEAEMARILIRKYERAQAAATPGGADLIGAAEEHLRQALRRWPRFAEARLMLGYILLNYRDRPEEGQRLMREAAELDSRLEPSARRLLRGETEDGPR